MKVKLLILLTLNICLQAQQLPAFAHYFNTKGYLNPSLAGLNNKMESFVVTKRNWTGSAVSYPSNFLSFDMPVSQQRIGLGLLALQDHLPFQQRIMLRANVSYKINLWKGYLRMGLSMGYTNSRLDLGSLNIKDIDDDYLQHLSPQSYFNSCFGLAYQRTSFLIGLAVRNLNRPKASYNANFAYNNIVKRNYTLYLEKKVALHTNLALCHYVAIAYSDAFDNYLSYIPYLTYKQDLSLGLGYRTKQTVYALVSLRLNKISTALDNFSVCYAYESGLGPLRNVTKNTHEIGLKMEFDKFSNLKSIQGKPQEITPIDF